MNKECAQKNLVPIYVYTYLFTVFTIINKKGKRKAVKKIKGYIHFYTAFVRALIYARERERAQTKNGRKKHVGKDYREEISRRGEESWR